MAMNMMSTPKHATAIIQSRPAMASSSLLEAMDPTMMTENPKIM